MIINKKTDVTIIGLNLNHNVIDNYPDYYVIDKPFKIEEVKTKEKILFFNSLHFIKDENKKILVEYLKKSKKSFIIITNNIEEVLLTKYLIVIDEEKILIEGQTLAVLKEDKLLKRLGFDLPFTFSLSLLLKDYDILDTICVTNQELVDEIWN